MTGLFNGNRQDEAAHIDVEGDTDRITIALVASASGMVAKVSSGSRPHG